MINGGGSYAKFSAGSIEIGTSGSFVAHASTHSLSSGKSMNVAIPITAARFGSSISSEQILNDLTNSLTWVEFKLIDEAGPIANEAYMLTDPYGNEHTGKVNEQGIARIDAIPAGHCKVELPNLGYAFEVSSS